MVRLCGFKSVPMRGFSYALVWIFGVYPCVGFAFVYFDNEQDAADAICGLANMSFGYDRRKLSIKWTKLCFLLVGRGRHGDGCRSSANHMPTKTLFVINFNPIHTRFWDIERHFEPYGKVINV
ncbi:hypothetical protein MLD38_027869 [Melastoma candidum]|uniref:Uncharacterized protein n=1 Tax=Melastoma candidum TaxID=119954 RepID=A0ACB9MZG4_9MYRT|nr:hypothetical protein MLD38_027869 [Melastoma candidum]